MSPLMSHAEIAAILGISRSAVWQIERRALRKLRAALLRRLGADWFAERGAP